MKRIYLDIETRYGIFWAWWTGEQYLSTDQIITPPSIMCICWKVEGESKVHTVKWDMKKKDDYKLLKDFVKWCDENDVDELVGHNSQNFDVRMINSRLAYHNLRPLPIFGFDDTIKQAKGSLRLPGYSLKFLCEYFQLPYKKQKITIQAWHDIINGTPDEAEKAMTQMIKYCVYDVRTVEVLADRLAPYVKTKRHPNVLAGGALPSKCGDCGTKIEGKGRCIRGGKIYYRGNCSTCHKGYYSLVPKKEL